MDKTTFVVQYAEAEDEWYDTRDGECSTPEAATRYRERYDREVGLPSRIIERYMREIVISQ